ncbi:MAG: hypothetical protein IPK79_08690 [Vampirovibrionales bacterium]|nr:hypothetical protein [Vampirovibrionales bacterium]
MSSADETAPESLETQEETAFETPTCERRAANADRRTRNRQGKYDRRRNRCRACLSFAWAPGQRVGDCQRHGRTFSPDAFACVWFDPKP